MEINNVTTFKRLSSLDALRGFDMFWIIGGEFVFRTLAKASGNPFLISLLPQLEHAEWQGFSFYDIIWPLFLFIVGCSMPFSFSKYLRENKKKALYFKIIRRTLILYVLGMITDGNLLTYDLSKIFIYNGVLQTIGIGYLIASLIILNFRFIWQAIITASLPVIYWILLVAIPVPGYGPGVLTPEGNIAIYLDKVILGNFQHGIDYAYILPSLMFGCMVMFGARSIQ